MTAHSIAWRQSFLDELKAQRGNVRKAAEVSGVSTSGVYKRREREPSFDLSVKRVLDSFPCRRGAKARRETAASKE